MKRPIFNAKTLTAALFATGLFAATGATALTQTPADPALTVSPANANAPVAAVSPPDFSQITEQYGPAVVNISVVGEARPSAATMDDHPLAPFFRNFPGFPGFPGMTPFENAPPQTVRGQGSGFIIDQSGIILTNAHVIQNAKEVTVKLTDRREFQAKVLGSDPRTDVAVLKIDAKQLPQVKLGTTQNLRVGEWVLAIGSPFGLENTVTAGVVSAKGRSLPNDSAVPFIQTDVAVNPGNSGGPLFNGRGEVVGINSQIYSETGGYQGLSFAIPIELALKIKAQIVEHGEVSHARLGVTIQEVNQALADSFGLDTPSGALVASVQPGSAADKAGLQAGDVIRQADDKTILSSGDLPAIVSLSNPGDTLTLQVWRAGKVQTLKAKLEAAPSTKETATASAPTEPGKLGLAIRPLTPEEQRQLQTQGSLRIEQVGGPAARAGVRPGDVLLAINGQPVQTTEQLQKHLQGSAKTLALLVQRDQVKIFIPVRLQP
ncbi:MAG: DegQ family serine endoprotease [Pigmentiphaga sp.]|nr:DegQ family serine endoprotease [Pigmentiphaga sp.]